VEKGTFLLPPYTLLLEAYTRCYTGLWRQASRML